MRSFLQDVRFAVRMMIRSPGVSVLAISVLAIGIAASTTMFSAVEAVILRPLPYRDPDRLTFIWTVDSKRGTQEDLASYPAYLDWKRQSELFEDMAALFLPALSNLTITGSGEAMLVEGAKVTPNLFELFGAAPVAGRTFTDAEADAQANVVVISHALWTQRFGMDPAAVGQALEVDGVPRRILGVMPPSFRFPTASTQVWEPHSAFPQWPAKRETRFSNLWAVIGRMKPGVSVPQAQAEMTSIASRLEAEHPDSHDGLGARVVPLAVQLTGESLRSALWLLFAASACLLVIACTNVANLLTAHGEWRAGELAIRTALGAGRKRLIRQLLTESLVLATAAGAAGVGLTFLGLRLLTRLAPADFPRLDEVELSLGVLGFAMLASTATVLLFGFWTAVRVSSRSPEAALRESARGTSAGSARRFGQQGLTVAQIALAVVLLSVAGLLTRSFERLQRVDPGFRSEGLSTITVSPPKSMTRLERTAFYRELLARVRALPGVASAAAITDMFSLSDPNGLLTAEGRPPTPRGLAIKHSEVSPGFFQTIGVPLLGGRFFTDHDNQDETLSVVINETMAQRFWPSEDAVGKRLKWGGPDSPRPWMTVVGVTRDARRQGLERIPVAEMFSANSYRSAASMDVVVRSELDPASLAETLRRTVHEVDPRAPASAFTTVQGSLDRLSADRRLQTWLLNLFASIALALAAIGVYGLQYRSVAQRRHELGIRMALGASAGEVLRLVFTEGVRLSLLGLVPGLLAALAVARLFERSLFGITELDWVSYAGASAVLMAAAAAASYLPVRRVLTIDPAESLRHTQ